MSAPIPLDEDLDNADWTKGTPDFPLIETPEEMRRFLDACGMTVGQFKRLPVYRWNRSYWEGRLP